MTDISKPDVAPEAAQEPPKKFEPSKFHPNVQAQIDAAREARAAGRRERQRPGVFVTMMRSIGGADFGAMKRAVFNRFVGAALGVAAVAGAGAYCYLNADQLFKKDGTNYTDILKRSGIAGRSVEDLVSKPSPAAFQATGPNSPAAPLSLPDVKSEPAP